MAKKFSIGFGLVFLLTGILGTLGGGHAHDLIIFGVNMPHNLVHLVTGILALVFAYAGERPARIFCFVFGSVYGLVTLAGFLNVPAVVEMLNLNMADNFLHLAVSIACLWAGFRSRALVHI